MTIDVKDREGSILSTRRSRNARVKNAKTSSDYNQSAYSQVPARNKMLSGLASVKGTMLKLQNSNILSPELMLRANATFDTAATSTTGRMSNL